MQQSQTSSVLFLLSAMIDGWCWNNVAVPAVSCLYRRVELQERPATLAARTSIIGYPSSVDPRFDEGIVVKQIFRPREQVDAGIEEVLHYPRLEIIRLSLGTQI